MNTSEDRISIHLAARTLTLPASVTDVCGHSSAVRGLPGLTSSKGRHDIPNRLFPAYRLLEI